MNKRDAVKNGLGRIRITDDSLTQLGLNKGDVTLIKLHATPKDGDLCAAFTAWGELMVRQFHRRKNGDVRLSVGIQGEVPQVFAPQALMIFGPVVSVEQRRRKAGRR
jgi:SOS-response transcriptional repressor LexA